ncbi:MAG: GNAT family N-acetyltransferase [Betaproteobacteria bacterium]|nr:GNAT family N-acetyltransferase [Betaproteobacteria bacterium]
MIRICTDADLPAILEIIGEAAQTCRGPVPLDGWTESYMSELRREVASHVVFWGYEEGGQFLGVMGVQDVADFTLVRHVYVRIPHRNRGISTALLSHLRTLTGKPILISSWKPAT